MWFEDWLHLRPASPLLPIAPQRQTSTQYNAFFRITPTPACPCARLPAPAPLSLTLPNACPCLPAAELEVEEGDVVNNKQRVWDNAEEQAQLFRQHLEELRAEGFDFDAVEA